MVIIILTSLITILLMAVPSLFDSFFFLTPFLEGKLHGLETLCVLLPAAPPAPETVLRTQRQLVDIY